MNGLKIFKLVNYQGCNTLPCVLNNLFKNAGLYYFINDDENIVITKDFAVNISDETPRTLKNNQKPETFYKLAR